MKLYRATVHILLPGDIEDEGTAADAVMCSLSENLKYDGAILDWEYLRRDDGTFSGPEAVELDAEEWDGDEMLISDLPPAVEEVN